MVYQEVKVIGKNGETYHEDDDDYDEEDYDDDYIEKYEDINPCMYNPIDQILETRYSFFCCFKIVYIMRFL